ncbi:MAG: pyridoxal-phosphate dependent enzyme, partial [Clostridia bacterium]|nr:pyridoxal-phosphate dependent enzyme [Clostridia bacterium]
PEHAAQVAKLASDALSFIGTDLAVAANETCLDQNYFGPGYEIPSDDASEAIRYLAREEGILLDPVYTGKAFAGMLAYIRKGKVPQGCTVVFWHTGGASALFADGYQELLSAS